MVFERTSPWGSAAASAPTSMLKAVMIVGRRAKEWELIIVELIVVARGSGAHVGLQVSAGAPSGK